MSAGCGFQALADYWATQLANALGQRTKGKAPSFIVGLHLRHVFGPSDRVVVGIECTKRMLTTAQRILEENRCQELHLFNHILDSLHYGRSERTARSPSTLCVRVAYKLDPNHSCHYLDDVADLHQDWRPTYDPWDENALAVLGAAVELKYSHMAARAFESIRFCATDTAAASIIDKPLDDGLGNKTLYTECLCGCQKLCEALDLAPSPLAHRSLTGGVYSLAKYALATTFGRETVTVMIRSPHPFGFALGFTLVSEAPVTVQVLAGGIQKLWQLFESVHEGPDQRAAKGQGGADHESQRLMAALGRMQQMGAAAYKVTAAPAPPSLIHTVADAVVPAGPDEGFAAQWMWERQGVRDRVRNFIEIASLFSDEYSEGRPLRFGLLMGNPALLKFWPGPRPILLNDGSDETKASKLAKHIHLLEDPERQCLVVGYPRTALTAVAHPDAWLIELEDFALGIGAWPESIIWEEDLRAYAYLTHRYPWAVAVVVGPGSEIRLLMGGRIAAFRNGKGWWRFVEATDHLVERGFGTWVRQLRDGEQDVLRMTVELALQMSPFVRSGSHGGLLVYLPLDNSPDNERCWQMQDKRLIPLHDFEPSCDQGKWLTGRTLLRASGERDWHVGSLVLRAALLDGSIVLCKPNGQVRYFGRQLAYVRPRGGGGGKGITGTKRANARAFVDMMATKFALPTAFAVAVSADGPIRLFYYSQVDQKADVVELFELVEIEP